MTTLQKLQIMTKVAWMDEMVRENFDDENIIDTWLMLGVPDHEDEIPMDDLEWYADNPDEYRELVELFGRLEKLANAS